jgi:hypothetical protein
MSIRKQARRERALARYPKSPKSRTGRRTEEQWKAERARLEALVQRG